MNQRRCQRCIIGYDTTLAATFPQRIILGQVYRDVFDYRVILILLMSHDFLSTSSWLPA